ncbi:hypothetical protein ACFVGY_36195, partial [Streptomyces sp. NPDC127106]|uniref:hypothetical protein n=1 Tax=Streptomyces sp. NPDC127106 TaxID=3345360 RepID=UPI003634A664
PDRLPDPLPLNHENESGPAADTAGPEPNIFISLLDDPYDDLDSYERESWADQLMWSVREIRTDLPMLFTTVTEAEPELSRRMPTWLDVDHPAMVMTDVCKPTILVRRTSPHTVEARMEIDPDEYRTGTRTVLAWEPLNLQEPGRG